MPPRRPDPVTRETVFRTYRVPDELRDAIAAKRQSLKQTVRAFIADAIDSELQPLIQDLKEHLPFYPTGTGRPARLPLTDPLLARLKAASDETGGWLSVTHLFLGVLHQAAHRKRRRSGAV